MPQTALEFDRLTVNYRHQNDFQLINPLTYVPTWRERRKFLCFFFFNCHCIFCADDLRNRYVQWAIQCSQYGYDIFDSIRKKTYCPIPLDLRWISLENLKTWICAIFYGLFSNNLFRYFDQNFYSSKYGRKLFQWSKFFSQC